MPFAFNQNYSTRKLANHTMKTVCLKQPFSETLNFPVGVQETELHDFFASSVNCNLKVSRRSVAPTSHDHSITAATGCTAEVVMVGELRRRLLCRSLEIGLVVIGGCRQPFYCNLITIQYIGPTTKCLVVNRL